MKKDIQDIVAFVKDWFDTKGVINEEQEIIKFVEQLQKQISQMDYSLPENASIIGYTGYSKGKKVFEIVDKTTKASGNNAKYISNLPAGQLLNDKDFKKEMLKVFGKDEITVAKIVNGYDISDGGWNNAVRLEGGSCGYGTFSSLDDFVSAKLMREATGVSNNIIIFAPENIDPTKVFATTEIEQIFKNSTFEYINGIPKSELEAIYRAGETGKQSFFEIINQTAKQAVGEADGIDSQASKLLDAFSENGILNQNSSDFSISTCYDANGNFTGVELTSSKSGTLIEKPQNTARTEEVVSVSDKNVSNSSGENPDIQKDNTSETNKKQDGSETSGEETGKKNDGDFEEKSIKEKEGSSEGDSTKKTEDADSSESGKKDTKETDTDTIKKEDQPSGKEDNVSGDKNLENSAESHKDTNSNNENIKDGGDVSAKENGSTNTDITENHSPKDNTSSGNGSQKETSIGVGDGGSTNNHDSHKTDTTTNNEHSNVDNTEHTKTESSGNHSDYDNPYNSDGGADTHTKTDVNDTTINEPKAQDVDTDFNSHDIDKPHTDIDINDGKAKLKSDYSDLGLTDKSKKVLEAFDEGSDGNVGKAIKNSKAAAKFNKIIKAADKIGDMADIVDAAYNIGKAIKLFNDGKVDEAGKTLRDYGFTTLGGMLAIPIAAILALSGVGTIPMLLIVGLAGWVGSEYGKLFSDIFDEIFGLYNDAGAYTYPCDPLIFDLNGDGVKTVSVADGVHFDFDKNGFAEKIGWVSADDGLLVRDLNNDGKISSGRELMGDLTELTENRVASNGFQAIGYYDENRDGVINSNDAIYSELKIWQDKNQNGTVDDGELATLEQAGIESINVAYENIRETDESGNSHSQKGSYTRADGTTGEIEDVWFAKDAADTILSAENNEQYYIEETDEIRNLPDIQGKGNQYSLHQAMLRDETGRLQEMVEEYVAEEDVYNRKKMLPNLIYAWTGVLDEDKFGRGEYLSDARKLEALEVITGRDFTSAYGANPVEGAVGFIEDAFDRLVYMYHMQLEMQTTYAGMYAAIWQNVDIDENDNIVFKADGLKDYLAPIVEQDPEKVKRMITGFIDNMNKTGTAGQVDMDSFREEISNLGEEYLYAYDHMGNDTIDGTDNDDTIVGGTGNDILNGGKGNDTYIFHLGDGRDVIRDDEGVDCIVFAEGIAPGDIRVWRDATDLYLTNKKTGDQVRVKNFHSGGSWYIESIEFADGTKWNIEAVDKTGMSILSGGASNYYGTDFSETISAKDPVISSGSSSGSSSSGGGAAACAVQGYVPVNNYMFGYSGDDRINGNKGDDHLFGGVGNDTLYGGDDDDQIYGEEGRDILYGGNGDDYLEGGVGRDVLDGGDGDDVYFFNLGDGRDVIDERSGADTIRFGEGILADDIKITRNNSNLCLTNEKSGDKITVRQFFYNTNYQIENIEFADGTKWDIEYLKDKARYYYGTDGNDSIYAQNSYTAAPTYEEDYVYGRSGNDNLSGNNGEDHLYGEEGNDNLYGGNGNDELIGGIGNDELCGDSGDDTYIFNLGDGQDIIDERSGADTIRFGEGITADDVKITRESYNLCLLNKKSGDKITIRNFFYKMNSQIENIEFADGTKWDIEYLKDKARYYYGTDGNDSIYAQNSYTAAPTYEEDYVYGRSGNDNLSGNNGEDHLYGEEGNDNLYGGNGNDELIGGIGNDELRGDSGDDTYIFNLGDGQDIIDERSGADTIRFGEGITAEDIKITRNNTNLCLTNEKSGDKITVKQFFYNTNYQIENVEFADGTKWDIEYLKDKARYYYGTDGDDTIYAQNSYASAPTYEEDYVYGGSGNDVLAGYNGDDHLYGEEGNDKLYGGTGNDELIGGIGNDNLEGDAGNDVYIFNLGDGQDIIEERSGADTIRFGEGITAEDIKITRNNTNLCLTNEKSGDGVTVRNFFYNTNYQIENVKFADGTKWDIEYLKDKARYYYGTDGNDSIYAQNSYTAAPTYEEDYIYGGLGNDTLYGNNGEDHLYGEEGNDNLYGGNGNDELIGGIGNDNLEGDAGNDVYFFNLGDGRDVIDERSGADTIRFGEGITAEDIKITRNNTNLCLTNEKSGDKITVKQFFYNTNYQIENIEFADGTKWDIEYLKDKARYYYGTDGNDSIYAQNSYTAAPTYEEDYMYGGLGNDTLYGNNGEDRLYGEEGNDKLYGGNGNDELIGGIGNDELCGDGGDDVYIFNCGDGQDIVYETAGYDTILWGDGITADNIEITKDSRNLYLSNILSGDKLTVNNFFYNTNNQVEAISTGDGYDLDMKKLDLIIQTMASFEDTDGMSWQDAVEQKNDHAMELMNQWWIKKAV